MKLNKKEWSALFAAMDFISSNSDGSDDIDNFHAINEGLQSIIEKQRRENTQAGVRAVYKKYGLTMNEVKEYRSSQTTGPDGQ